MKAGEGLRTKPDYVYVASSWRNPIHTAVCAALKSAGINHYDFKNPPESSAFHWSHVISSYPKGALHNPKAPLDEYLEALIDPISISGYECDMAALRKADCVIAVLPCGRSAHLELGYAVGTMKDTAILMDGPMVTPELMYKMVNYLAPSLFDLLGWLGVED